MKYTLPGLAVEYAPRPSVQRNPGHGESSVIREPHHPQRSLVASGPKDADCFLRSSVNGRPASKCVPAFPAAQFTISQLTILSRIAR